MIDYDKTYALQAMKVARYNVTQLLGKVSDKRPKYIGKSGFEVRLENLLRDLERGIELLQEKP